MSQVLRPEKKNRTVVCVCKSDINLIICCIFYILYFRYFSVKRSMEETEGTYRWNRWCCKRPFLEFAGCSFFFQVFNVSLAGTAEGITRQTKFNLKTNILMFLDLSFSFIMRVKFMRIKESCSGLGLKEIIKTMTWHQFDGVN